MVGNNSHTVLRRMELLPRQYKFDLCSNGKVICGNGSLVLKVFIAFMSVKFVLHEYIDLVIE